MKKGILMRAVSFIVFATLAVVGAARAAEYAAGDRSAYGTILLSTGSAKECYGMATQLTVYPLGQPYGAEGIAAVLEVDNAAIKSDFPTHKGNVHTVVLPAGTYYLAERIPDPSLKPVKIMGASFKLASGETLYLGEFFLDQSCAMNTHYVVGDREERDLPLLLARNPGLRREAINKRVMQFSDPVVGGAGKPVKPAR